MQTVGNLGLRRFPTGAVGQLPNDRRTMAAHPDSKPHTIGYVKPLDLEPVEHEGNMIEYAGD